MIDRSHPWIFYPPADDLANTDEVTPAGPVDQLATPDELAVWSAGACPTSSRRAAASGRCAT